MLLNVKNKRYQVKDFYANTFWLLFKTTWCFYLLALHQLKQRVKNQQFINVPNRKNATR